MKKYVLFLLFIFSLKSEAQENVITTINPIIERQSSSDVTIQKVVLTSRYTILYMTFRNSRDFYSENSQEYVSFESNCKLIDPETKQTFAFIRSENISTENKIISPRQKISFVTYFERLSPGITVFDLFEGRNIPNSGKVYWNFYGIFINNPHKLPNNPSPAGTLAKKIPQAETAQIWFTGKAINAHTQEPIHGAKTYIKGLNTKDSAFSSSNGTFIYKIYPEQAYECTVSKEGYLTVIEKIKSNSDTKLKFELIPIERGKSMLLQSVQFKSSSFELIQESHPELDRLARWMKDNPKMHIRLEGHTDNVGSSEANLKLSFKRVEVIKEELFKRGVPSERVEAIGLGDTQTIHRSDSREEHEKNRRVEFIITQL